MYRLMDTGNPRTLDRFDNVKWGDKEGTLVVMEFDEDWSGGAGLG